MPEARVPRTNRKVASDAAAIENIAQAAPVCFRPIWNVEKSYLCGYIARPAGQHPALLFADPDEKAPLGDLCLLVKAARALADLQERGEKSVVVVPVSFDTLNLYPWRGHFLSLLRRTPEHVRSFIVLSITNIPPGAPKQRLQTIQNDVRDLCRALAFATDLRGRHLDCVVRGNVHACQITMPEGLSDEEDMPGVVGRFADKVGCMECAAMADNVATRAALVAAVAAGFRYIAGQAVLPDQPELGISRRSFNLSMAVGIME